MQYLLAILFPPLAVLTCQQPAQALMNLFLTLCFWVPGAIHALVVVKQFRDAQRASQLIDEMQNHRISWALKKIV